MTARHKARSASEPAVPYGTQTSRPRWVLVLWIVLSAAWLAFLVALVAHDRLRS